MEKHEIVILVIVAILVLSGIGYIIYTNFPPSGFGNAGGGTATPAATTPAVATTITGTSIPIPAVVPYIPANGPVAPAAVGSGSNTPVSPSGQPVVTSTGQTIYL